MLKITLLCAIITACITAPAAAQYSSYDRGYNDAWSDAEYQKVQRYNEQVERDWSRQIEQDRLDHQRAMDEIDRRSQMEEMQRQMDDLRWRNIGR